ncbi:FAD-dependent monooxygenase [Cellulomonas sp.]|uniref:FAD-dependent monooxygenase n=1 Tax=Cellulomonas sp. TaxID=40001 RepID=UPI003BA927DE
MQVTVVGAGIGGLAVAVGLHRRGHQVTVLERSADLTAVGAGISLFANGLAALRVLGLADEVRALAAPHDPTLRTGQRQPSGRWLVQVPPGSTRDLAVVHRQDLQRVLLAALPAGVVRTGVEVTGVEHARGVVTDASGARTSADLVIGADGLRSAVRGSFARGASPRYAGYTAWRGVTDGPVDLLGTAGETWGRGERFGYVPLRDGRAYWFAVASLPAGTRFADEVAEVRRRFDHWHDPIPALVACTDPAAVLRHDIHDLDHRLPSFVQGRVALLGDAAHAMTPDVGQGGGQALEDAATLAVLCGGDLRAALAEYDRVRRPRTQTIARRARTVGRVAQLAWGPAAAVRDLLLRATPDAASARAAEALQRWDPPA